MESPKIEVNKQALTPLTWKVLAKSFDTQTVKNNSPRSSFKSWKIVELVQNELTKTNPSWNHEEGTKWRKSMSWN